MKTTFLEFLWVILLAIGTLFFALSLTHDPSKKEEVSLTVEQWMVLHENAYMNGAIWFARHNTDDGVKRLDSLEMVKFLNQLNEVEK